VREFFTIAGDPTHWYASSSTMFICSAWSTRSGVTGTLTDTKT